MGLWITIIWNSHVHGTSKWKIRLYEGDLCSLYSGYKYGVENQSTIARRKRPDRPHPLTLSTAKLSQAAPSNAGEGQPRKRKSRALRVIETVSLAWKKSRRGASHRGADNDVPSGSPVVPPSPAAGVITLIEDYASGDEDGVVTTSSPACRRQIDFFDEPI